MPLGPGNIEVRRSEPFAELAASTVAAIKSVCVDMSWNVSRIAIDAPAAPARTAGRNCERQLTAAGLSVFKTPRDEEWKNLICKCRAHLDSGGPLSHLPNANRIWMLYGFELFSALRKAGFEVIEVYPFAIIHALLPIHPHKSLAQGYELQLDALAAQTGWTPSELQLQLRGTVPGKKPHDRLDAFMAAWVANLPNTSLRAYGDPHDLTDAIWVPVT
jgi:predicted nuclease with RNAse H fold